MYITLIYDIFHRQTEYSLIRQPLQELPDLDPICLQRRLKVCLVQKGLAIVFWIIIFYFSLFAYKWAKKKPPPKNKKYRICDIMFITNSVYHDQRAPKGSTLFAFGRRLSIGTC